FLSGVGDTLTLVTDRLGFATAAASIKSGVQTAATWAQTAATKASTLATKGLNAAIKANPIGALIAVVILLVGALVLAYKKSETFQKIVKGAFNAVKRAADFLKDGVLGAFGKIRDGLGNAADWIRDKFNGIVDFFRNAPARVANATRNLWNGIGDSFKGILNKLIRWWNELSFNINLPDFLPGVPDSVTINTPNIGYLASGGYGAPGRTYLTGENGPELIRFGTGGGMVTPNNRLGLDGIADGELRELAGRLLDMLADLMGGAIAENSRALRRRVLAGAGGI
ncbi:MAG: hypothetical protein ACRDXB_14100, partial [Actinomycetes bacterium]